MATLSELLADPKRQLVIKQRQVAMEFGLEIERYMAKTRVKRSELAARIGKSRAWISKFLYGPRNLKVFTAVEIANAIDCDVELRLVPRQAELAIPRTADFVAQVHSAARAMAQFGIGVPPPHPTVSSPGMVVAQGLRV
jgi:transcriptional regulator with XRE-family HTH domain